MEEKRKVPFDIPLNETLKDRFSFTFGVPKASIYFVEITASAKNKKQNIYPRWLWRFPLPVLSIFGKDDDDLYVRIDGREFPKLGGVKGLYDAPAAWSGASLKNTSKTNIFILFLEKGAHALTFHPDETPTLRRIRCEKLETTQRLRYPLKYNNPPERKERSSWYTFTLVDLPLIQFDITGTVQKRKKWLFFTEGDDIKIVLDGKTQKNDKPKAHKSWIFCARAQIGSDSFTSQPRWRPGLHYIELFADWTPTIEEISFSLIQSYKPYLDRNYNRYDKEILKATAYWNNFFLKQKYPPPESLDPHLVKAIVYVESGIGYHEGPNPPYPDVMQIGNPGDPALPVLNNDGILPTESEAYTGETTPLDYEGAANTKTPQQSIHWGVRWLYHKAQGIREGRQYWFSWREAVENYGPPKEIYSESIWNLYKSGKNPDGGENLF